MDYKLRRFLTLLVVICCFIQSTATIAAAYEDEQQQKEEEYVHQNKASDSDMNMIEMVKSLFSFPTTFPQTSNYWIKLKTFITQGYAYVNPPNLDFRKGNEGEARGEGTREKVKVAVVKSLEKSKATIQGSAKSAAEVAGETAKKLKKSLSQKNKEPQAEL